MDRTNFRKGLLASIHIAKKDLGLDDETYREMLFNLTGEVSAAKCTVRQMQAVLAECRKKGWAGSFREPAGHPALVPLKKKILAQCGALEVPASYAGSILKRQCGKTLSTASREELTACIAALTVQQKRLARKAE